MKIFSNEREIYINEKIKDLKKFGIRVSGEVNHGNPVKIIITAAKKPEDQLLILGTHGKAGSEAFWSESVAARIAPVARYCLCR